MKKDQRGLKIYTDFNDTYGANVLVKQSSSACYDRCWIFIEGGRTENENEKNEGSAHLSKQQARWIIKALQKFLNK